MKPEPHDPILDACLEEILGGQGPPDLSDSILQNWQRQVPDGQPIEPVATSAATGSDDSLLAAPTQAAIHSATSSENNRPLELPQRRQRSAPGRFWSQTAIALSMLTIGTCFGFIALKVFLPQGSHESETSVADLTTGQSSTAPSSSSTKDSQDSQNQADRKNQVAGNGSQDSQKNNFPGNRNNKNRPPKETTPSFSKSTPSPSDVASSSDSPSATRIDSLDDQTIIKVVNQQLSASWQAANITPSPMATDAEWCRRIYLRLLGRIPTKEELDRFVQAKPSANKRVALVDELLENKQYVEEYSRHWTTIWTNLLIGRRGGIGKGELANREGLQQYLQEGFQQNKPYDQMAYELISATGSNTPGTEDYNGAVNFILASMNDQATLATARTSRIFLGKQLQCVQCHKHPSNDWSQLSFWEMNAFFRQAQVVKGKQANVHQLVNRDFVGKQGNADDAEIYFGEPDGSMAVAYPRFLGGKPLEHNGQVAQFDRRTQLATLVRQSDDLSQALVNRVWAHFLGFGFTRPIDDMGHHNPPTHPRLLKHLSEQFVAHDYDVQDLFRWIALSDAFALSSRLSSTNSLDSPEFGDVPHFSRYYMRPMEPEEVYQSLLVVAGRNRTTGSAVDIEQARRDWLSQFARKMETDEGDESNLFSGNIHQSLVMMNGPLMKQATSANTHSVLASVMESKMETHKKVDHLFLAAVARKPSKRELKLVQQMLDKTTPEQMLQDIWWALLNSNEFILDH